MILNYKNVYNIYIFVLQLEKDDESLPDCLYERLCFLMSKSNSNTNFCRIFIQFPEKDFILLHENIDQISNGTTGLSCWQVKILEITKFTFFLN